MERMVGSGKKAVVKIGEREFDLDWYGYEERTGVLQFRDKDGSEWIVSGHPFILTDWKCGKD